MFAQRTPNRKKNEHFADVQIHFTVKTSNKNTALTDME